MRGVRRRGNGRRHVHAAEPGRQPGQGPQGPDADRRLRDEGLPALRLPPRRGAPDRERPRGDGRAELGARPWLRVGDRVRGRPDRPHRAADHRDLQAHEQPQRRRARLCGDAAPAARRLFDQPKGWMQISIVAEDRGDVGPLKKRVEHVLGSGARVQTPGEVSDQISTSSPGSTSFSTSSRAWRCSSAAS